jgi:hypothetical protein
MPDKTGKAVAYAILIWIIGFIWGSVVFMTPSLKSVPAIPYISSNPAISFPILIIWLVVSYLLSRMYLEEVEDQGAEGAKLGLTFFLVNIILDLFVLVILLKAGFGYFISLTVVGLSDVTDNSLVNWKIKGNGS